MPNQSEFDPVGQVAITIKDNAARIAFALALISTSHIAPSNAEDDPQPPRQLDGGGGIPEIFVYGNFPSAGLNVSLPPTVVSIGNPHFMLGRDGGGADGIGNGTTPGEEGHKGPQKTGPCGTSPNPVLIAEDTKVKSELDFRTAHLYPLELERNYNQTNDIKGLFGDRWSTSFDRSLSFGLNESPRLS